MVNGSYSTSIRIPAAPQKLIFSYIGLAPTWQKCVGYSTLPLHLFDSQ